MSYIIYNNKLVTIGGKLAGGAIVYNDWVLPVQAAIAYMTTNLYDQGIGGLSGTYWSSRESTSTTASYQAMSGSGASRSKSDIYNVRPVRYFIAEVGKYTLRSVGPAGGWIFYNSSNFYGEAYIMDLQTSVWSNVSNALAGADRSHLGEGCIFNTNKIITQAGHTNSAAKLCSDLIVYR